MIRAEVFVGRWRCRASSADRLVACAALSLGHLPIAEQRRRATAFAPLSPSRCADDRAAAAWHFHMMASHSSPAFRNSSVISGDMPSPSGSGSVSRRKMRSQAPLHRRWQRSARGSSRLSRAFPRRRQCEYCCRNSLGARRQHLPQIIRVPGSNAVDPRLHPGTLQLMRGWRGRGGFICDPRSGLGP